MQSVSYCISAPFVILIPPQREKDLAVHLDVTAKVPGADAAAFATAANNAKITMDAKLGT